MGAIETILLATDLGPGSNLATEKAIELAVGLWARLLVVNVVDPGHDLAMSGSGPFRPVEEREARALAAHDVVGRARALGARATFLVWDGDVADGVVAAADAEGADLIIVGTDGGPGAGHPGIGRVSDSVIRRAHCPVLVVRRGPDPGCAPRRGRVPPG